MIHFVLLKYSRHVAQWIQEVGCDLMGKSDSRFMEGVYKLLRGQFNYNPSLTLPQFFTLGFAVHKAMLLTDLIEHVKSKDAEIRKLKEPKKRAQ